MVSTLDFRRLDDGNKRKNRDEEEEMAVDVKRLAVPSLENPNKPSPLLGRPTFDGVIAGKPSGRRWKIPRTHRSSASQVTRTRTTPEQRAREKEVKRAFRERKEELKEEIRRHKIEMREKREEREKRKKENILRSGTKLQVISNPKTLKKIAKSKHKKLLKVVPDDLVHKVLGHEGDGATEEAKKSNHAVRKLEKRQQGRKLDAHVEGQCGRADGYILEGKELEFYMKKIQRKKGKGGAA